MHLVRRPALDGTSRLWLLMGLGPPIASATTANVAGFQATQARTFCGSCHVMHPHRDDSQDPKSTSLACSIDARNHNFGADNCYSCHKDYGMYGFVITSFGGMRHVYMYLTEYRSMPLEVSKHDIRIRNRSQRQLHGVSHGHRAALARGPGSRRVDRTPCVPARRRARARDATDSPIR